MPNMSWRRSKGLSPLGFECFMVGITLEPKFGRSFQELIAEGKIGLGLGQGPGSGTGQWLLLDEITPEFVARIVEGLNGRELAQRSVWARERS
jgi:hypothetical protein